MAHRLVALTVLTSALGLVVAAAPAASQEAVRVPLSLGSDRVRNGGTFNGMMLEGMVAF